MSKLTLQAIGRLGKDCEVQELKNGKSAIRFSIATNPYKDKTVWVDCTIFRDSDKTKVADYLNKGINVFVEGEPGVNVWVDKNDEAHGTQTLIVNNLVLLGSKDGDSDNSSKKSSSNKSSAKSSKPKFVEVPDDDDDDDLPF